MPILTIHLVENTYSDKECQELLKKSSELYASVLYPDLAEDGMARVRVFINIYKANSVAFAGVPYCKSSEKTAPYFEFLVLAGRPVEEKHQLLIGFTDLIEDILGSERSLIRGGCWPIPPEDWCIGGVPASLLRAGEVQSRENLE